MPRPAKRNPPPGPAGPGPIPPAAGGSIIAAQEAGLREASGRVAAAIVAGARPLAATPLAAMAGLWPATTPQPVVKAGVAVIDVVGPLAKAETLYTWLFGTLTYPQLAEQVHAARRDVRVQAALLRIDSPGGTVAGVSDLVEAIAEFRAVKPVAAAISDLGASCAYQIAAQASRIVIDSDGWAGSIGVYLVIDDLSQLYSQAGWQVRLFATNADPHKGAGTPGTPVTDEQAAEYQRMVDELGTEMIRSIYAGRAALRTGGLALPDGRVYLGADAVARGLADAVAAWPAALAAMIDGDYDLAKLVTAPR